MTNIDNLYGKLRVIESADPDGGHREPTEEDYANHKRWAISQYGIEVWEIYEKGGYDDTRYEY